MDACLVKSVEDTSGLLCAGACQRSCSLMTWVPPRYCEPMGVGSPLEMMVVSFSFASLLIGQVDFLPAAQISSQAVSIWVKPALLLTLGALRLAGKRSSGSAHTSCHFSQAKEPIVGGV